MDILNIIILFNQNENVNMLKLKKTIVQNLL